jgi:hypothetical protein
MASALSADERNEMNGRAVSLHLIDQANREEAYERALPLRIEQAEEAIQDIAELKKILNDEDLANFLAPIMQDFGQAMNEINDLALQGRVLTLANLMRNVARLRTCLIEMHAGER